MKIKKIGIIVVLIVVFIVIVIVIPSPKNNALIVPSIPAQFPTTIPFSCHIVNDTLPDLNCTPGAIDPRVTQENIDSTICVSGYTETVRPPVSVTEPQKLQSMKQYGFDDSPSNYEFDHLIPLELGGAPDDLKNLWPEPHSSSYDKDAVENYLHEQVCSGNMKLKTAQDLIATNWYDYWLKSRN